MYEDDEFFCPQCDCEFPDGHPEELLLSELVFCSEECADAWLEERAMK